MPFGLVYKWITIQLCNVNFYRKHSQKLNHLNYMLNRFYGAGLGGSFKVQIQYSDELLTVMENCAKLLILN